MALRASSYECLCATCFMRHTAFLHFSLGNVLKSCLIIQHSAYLTKKISKQPNSIASYGLADFQQPSFLQCNAGWRKIRHGTQALGILNVNSSHTCNPYRQMGELWTLFEFACSLYLTCNMVLDTDGSISWVLLCIMIFSTLRLYGIKFSIN